jgi:hypothetical protein
MTANPHLAPKVKKEWSYTSTPPTGPSWPVLGWTLPLPLLLTLLTSILEVTVSDIDRDTVCYETMCEFLSVPLQPNSGLGRPIVAVSRSHTVINTAGRTPLNQLSVGRIGLYLHSKHKRRTSMPSAGFDPLILAFKRPQTHAWDHAETGIGACGSTQSLPTNIGIARQMRPLFLFFTYLPTVLIGLSFLLSYDNNPLSFNFPD